MHLYRLFPVALIILLTISASAQDNVLIQRLMGDGKIIKAMLPWNAEHADIVCIHSSQIGDSLGTSDALSFYQKDSLGYREVFHFESGYPLVGIFQDCEYKGNLIATWIAGSGYGVTAFSYANHQVKVVLDDGSKILPEFAYVGSRLRYDVIVPQHDWVMDRKKGHSVSVRDSARVYRWEGNRYQSVKLPWQKRIESPKPNK
jgi:hypothetical protein